MPHYTLLLLEVTGIQDYVFKSNHLVQNIGASELVQTATEEWLSTTIENEDLQSNFTWNETDGLILDSKQHLSNSKLDVELIYSGGGVAMLLFANDNNAANFLARFTRKTLEEATGLQPVAIYDKFDWEKDSLAGKHRELRGKLAARKLDRRHSAPMTGLGVTAKCVFTGMPAVGWDNDPELVGHEAAERKKRLNEPPRRICAEVAKKLKNAHRARKRLSKIAPEVDSQGFEFAANFNDFGEKGTSSFIAVIHADGNAMGMRFNKIGEKYHEPEKNDQYVKKLHEFSLSIRDITQDALGATIKFLLAQWPDYVEKLETSTKRGPGGKKLLPFRPIVFGGDDVTFVSEGKLGLILAAKYLQELSKRELADGEPPFARAGVAVVKSHYPFSRAYRLAEQLTDNAKKRIGYLTQPTENNTFVMDWHFSTTGVEAGLNAIREREYSAESGNPLLMRPVRIGEPEVTPNVWRTWQTFAELTNAFQNRDEWSGRRNKIKALADALRRGPRAVVLFLRNYGLGNLPEIPGLENMARTGWQGEECGYFDAIEATDFFIALNDNINGEKA